MRIRPRAVPVLGPAMVLFGAQVVGGGREAGNDDGKVREADDDDDEEMIETNEGDEGKFAGENWLSMMLREFDWLMEGSKQTNLWLFFFDKWKFSAQ